MGTGRGGAAGAWMQKPMNANVGWALAVLAVASGWWQWGWRGVVLALTMVVFWLLLQFGRSLRVMQKAGSAPMGSVANAVMLHSRLRAGLPLLQILPLTGSLGIKLADDPETFAWQDASGDRVELVLRGGKLASWQLVRAAGEPVAPAGADAADAPAAAGPAPGAAP